MNRLLALLLCAVVLAGCSTKQQTGGLVGAAGGAAVGSQIGGGSGRLIAIGLGALLGAWLGSEAGQRLDDNDRAVANRTTETALERGRTGETYEWRNPDSGNSGTVTPTSKPVQRQGLECREFSQTVSAAGQTAGGRGMACRQADGSWQVVS